MKTPRTAPLTTIVVTLCCASLAVAQGEPPQHPVFPEAPTVDRLDNGFTLVTVPWSSPGIASYFTLVRVGSRDEVEPGRSGFAHLFEHMMFRGSENFPGEAYELAMQAFGADTNAYTTSDYTMYVVTAPSSALPRLVELESDRFLRLQYDEEAFRTETGAVLGEYNTSSAGPGMVMWERLKELAFSSHTYGHTTMGYLRDICAMPEMFAYSQQFFQRYYTPDNTTLIVVGDFDHDSLLEMVTERYGAWEGSRFDNAIPEEAEPNGERRDHLVWSGATSPRASIAFRSPGFLGDGSDEGRSGAIRQAAALEVIRALAFHESSPLFQRLVVDEQTLLRLSSWENSFSIDPHLFNVSLTFRPTDDFDPATSFEPAIDAVQQTLADIAAGGVSQERIAAVQSHIRYGLVADLQTPGNVANTVGRMIAVGGGAESLVEYLDALASLTADEVAEVAGRFLTIDRRSVVTLAPAGEGEDAEPRPTCADFGGDANEGGAQ